MGTRSLTYVYDGDERLVCMYRQMDGYPSGMGQDLYEFLSQFTIVNGIGLNEDRKIANGAGCLAAQLVAHFKGDSPGGFYLYPTKLKQLSAWQEYEYHIHVAEVGFPIHFQVFDVRNGKRVMPALFDGDLDAFPAWLELYEKEAA